jgi:hypothetical protein
MVFKARPVSDFAILGKMRMKAENEGDYGS